MRSHCAADMQKRSMMMSAGGNISLAAFLITRPPYGYIGCAFLSLIPVTIPAIHMMMNYYCSDGWEGCGPPGKVVHNHKDGSRDVCALRPYSRHTVPLPPFPPSLPSVDLPLAAMRCS